MPGGPVDGDVPSGARASTVIRKDTDIEPISFNTSTKSFWEEILFQTGDAGKIRAVIDLTPTDDKLGMICLETSVPYLAITFSETHAKLLKSRLQKQTWESFLSYREGKNPPVPQ